MPNTPLIPPDRRHVAFVTFPDVQLLDVTGPLQVFATANDLARRAGHPAPYRLSVVAASAGAIVSSSGLALLAEPLPPTDETLDTLIIAGGPGVTPAAEDPALLGWIARRAPTTRRIASVCTGAFVLAATGLLDGHRATTHWSRCAALAACFPAITVEPDPIYIAEGGIWTSAGVTAGIDMALAMLEADHGRDTATAVARHLVVFAKRPGGQSQFSTTLSLGGTDETFDALHDWIRQNLRANLTVPELARRSGMSERGFVRHYRRITGTTPARAVERLRVEAARQALGETSLPVKRIARDCGFGSEETMRRGFIRVLSVSPSAYRERFPV